MGVCKIYRVIGNRRNVGGGHAFSGERNKRDRDRLVIGRKVTTTEIAQRRRSE